MSCGQFPKWIWLDKKDSERLKRLLVEEAVSLDHLPATCLQISLCLSGCPDGKKLEFITSLLDALTTDMVQAINSAAPTGGGR